MDCNLLVLFAWTSIKSIYIHSTCVVSLISASGHRIIGCWMWTELHSSPSNIQKWSEEMEFGWTGLLPSRAFFSSKENHMIRQGKSTLGHSIRLQTLTAIQWKQEPQQLAGVILSVVGDSPGPNVTEDHEHLGPINMALQRNQALQAVIPSQLFLSQCQVLETLANLRLTAVLMSPNITKTYQKQTNNLASGDLPPPPPKQMKSTWDINFQAASRPTFLNSCSGPSVGPSTRTWKPKPCSAKATFRSNSELSELGSMGPRGPRTQEQHRSSGCWRDGSDGFHGARGVAKEGPGCGCLGKVWKS